MKHTFSPTHEIERITDLIKNTFNKTGIGNCVIAWSGGIDSTVSLYLLARTLPKDKITILHLPYETSYLKDLELIKTDLHLLPSQIHEISIKPMVDATSSILFPDELRKGNIMARTRMIVVFDWAKKLNALVCGTENKTERLLGYFTRFGDQASDIEPIQHLYKTQVYELAKALQVSSTFIERAPSAGLWKGQTDEEEFGFTYREADEVLIRLFEYSKTIEEIEQDGFKNARKIKALVDKNSFKHKVPYKVNDRRINTSNDQI